MITTKRPTTQKRHKIVVRKYTELINQKFENGLRPSYDSVLELVVEETGYSTRYIEDIIRQSA